MHPLLLHILFVKRYRLGNGSRCLFVVLYFLAACCKYYKCVTFMQKAYNIYCINAYITKPSSASRKNCKQMHFDI